MLDIDGGDEYKKTDLVWNLIELMMYVDLKSFVGCQERR